MEHKEQRHYTAPEIREAMTWLGFGKEESDNLLRTLRERHLPAAPDETRRRSTGDGTVIHSAGGGALGTQPPVCKLDVKRNFGPGESVRIRMDIPGIDDPVGTVLFRDPADGSYKVDLNGMQLWYSDSELLPVEKDETI